jgi:hypothetical protein
MAVLLARRQCASKIRAWNRDGSLMWVMCRAVKLQAFTARSSQFWSAADNAQD